MSVLVTPAVVELIAWMLGAFLIGGMIMAVMLYMAEFLGWLAT